jgi:hypothetical protein
MKGAAVYLLMSLLLTGVVYSEPPTAKLVLIVSVDSKVEQLDSLEVRKLFLGMTVEHHGSRLRALLNESDSLIKEVFLQNVVAMTDTTYDRRLLQLALQHGAVMPTIYINNVQLLASVAVDPVAVSFAWYRDVAQDKKIKILRVLWHD